MDSLGGADGRGHGHGNSYEDDVSLLPYLNEDYEDGSGGGGGGGGEEGRGSLGDGCGPQQRRRAGTGRAGGGTRKGQRRRGGPGGGAGEGAAADASNPPPLPPPRLPSFGSGQDPAASVSVTSLSDLHANMEAALAGLGSGGGGAGGGGANPMLALDHHPGAAFGMNSASLANLLEGAGAGGGGAASSRGGTPSRLPRLSGPATDAVADLPAFPDMSWATAAAAAATAEPWGLAASPSGRKPSPPSRPGTGTGDEYPTDSSGGGNDGSVGGSSGNGSHTVVTKSSSEAGGGGGGGGSQKSSSTASSSASGQRQPRAQQQQPQDGQLHHLAMQSTATCPPMTAATNVPSGLLQAPFFGFGGSNHLAAAAQQVAAAQQQGAAVTAAAAATNPLVAMYAQFQQAQQQAYVAMHQHQGGGGGGGGGGSGTGGNSGQAGGGAPLPVPPSQQQPRGGGDSRPAAAAAGGRRGSGQAKKQGAAATAKGKRGRTPRKKNGAAASARARGGGKAQAPASNKAAAGPPPPSSATPPPFYLFEAPYELRMNYLQSQLGSAAAASAPGGPLLTSGAGPVHPGDPNSYHYGMAVSGVSVNGFHPQINARSNPIVPLAGTAGGGGLTVAALQGQQQSTLAAMAQAGGPLAPQQVRFVDGRNVPKGKGKGNVKERNEREQRRAQKIAELIEKLRLSMVRGGWKVEMKSKYHTLSTCADYVKHLIEKTEEKESAVKKAKSDLAEREQANLEKEKAAAAEGMRESDETESETSSLTAASPPGTPSSGRKRGLRGHRSRRSKRVRNLSAALSDGDEGDRVDGASRKDKESSSATDSMDDSSTGGETNPGGKNINITHHEANSTISDMTDSNRSEEPKPGSDGGDEADDASAFSTSSSVSSDAAVVRGSFTDRRPRHADVVIPKKKKSSRRRRKSKGSSPDATDLEDDFQLDYEEVFITSNLPQLIATPAGKVVTWNDLFLKATGLTCEEAQRLSIFTIVQADKLATLFELVGKALKSTSKSRVDSQPTAVNSEGNGDEATSAGDVPSSESVEDGSANSATALSAVTLPCIPFHSSYPNHSATSSKKRCAAVQIPLYMTVTLMSDDDPRKRCFHCVLTDTPSTVDGQIGSVTPELLAMLFTQKEGEVVCEVKRPSES